MALVGKEEKAKDGGTEKRKLIVTVDNGTLEQLDELRTYFSDKRIIRKFLNWQSRYSNGPKTPKLARPLRNRHV
jgi:hypothetical protein